MKSRFSNVAKFIVFKMNHAYVWEIKSSHFQIVVTKLPGTIAATVLEITQNTLYCSYKLLFL